MSDLKELDLEKLSELTTGSAENFKEGVNEMDLTLQDLRALKTAEASGKNRDQVLEFLDRQISTENVAAYLGVAEEDIGELGDLINEIERIEDVQHFEEDQINIGQDQLIDLVGGTVDEMKEFVDENPLTAEQIQDILEAEKRVKDRKTAKKFLERKIKKRNIGEDVEEAREDLENLKKDLKDVKGDEGLEKSEESEEKSSDDSSDSEDEEETEENSAEEQSEEKDEEKEPEDNGSEEEDASKQKESSEEKEEDSESEDGEERKREIVEELELDMSDEELEGFSLNDLEKIKSEKEHREELIERLEDEGMEEEELRNSSTEDLEKIVESLEEGKESKEEHEEMREEAEEDLEMLMGAVRDQDGSEEDSGRNTREKIGDIKSSIKDKLNRSKNKDEEESDQGINADKVEEILDQYRELDDDEASIKTAHIMKGFLEKSLGIERELTYKELAENMPEEDESMNDLADFFLKMHREQYTGKFKADDSDEVIDMCEEVISELG